MAGSSLYCAGQSRPGDMAARHCTGGFSAMQCGPVALRGFQSVQQAQ